MPRIALPRVAGSGALASRIRRDLIGQPGRPEPTGYERETIAMDADLKFSPALLQMVTDGRVAGRDGQIMTPTGMASKNTLLTLRNLCMSRGPKRTLEVGLAYGSSGLVFAQSHYDLGHAPTGQHIAMDPFQADMGDAGLAQLERAGKTGFVTFYREPSHVVLARLLADGPQFDLCFVDGSHLFEDCFIDGFYCARLLAPDGALIFDDATDPHVKKVTRFIERNLSQSLVDFDLGPFRADHGSTVKYRVAKTLGRSQLRAFRKIGDPTRLWNASFVNF
jgi:predicted O-methyltransferase YrrM